VITKLRAALGVVALLGLLAGCGGPGKFADETAPFSVESPAPSTPPTSTAGVIPTGVRIAAIGLDSTAMMQVGLNSDHSMEVPPLSQPKLIGWFKLSPVPGESALCPFAGGKGCVQPAVLGAHVNANGVQGAFAKLAQVKVGAEVQVDRSDQKTAVFKVTKTKIFSKTAFDTKAVYGGSGPSLVLLTCGPGAVVKGSYLNQTVVWATLVTVKPTT
jgi:LPXTG-site transpeptidase (sortase) family protein